MKHNGAFDNNVQTVWDSTSIGYAETCPRKYYYTMIRQKTPKYKSVHLVFGGHYATALERFYKYVADGLTIDQATVRVVKEALIDTWDDEKNCGVEFDHGAKTRYTLIRSIVWYLDVFGDETDSNIKTHHLSDGKPAVELSFKLPMTQDIILSGHLDRVVSMGDPLYVMDQKTTGGTIGTYFFNQFKPSTQMSCYTLAGKILLQSPIKGVIIDGAQIAVGFTKFERGMTHRTEEELNEWWSSAQYHIQMTQHMSNGIKDEPDDVKLFPMNCASCGNYGGCDFRPVCSAPPQARESILRTDFVENVWDPTVDR